MIRDKLVSSDFNHSKSMKSKSTPKDVQTNTSLQTKQKSTKKPDKPLTSTLFGFQNNAINDGTYFSDAEDDKLQLNKWLPSSVNQRTRKKEQDQIKNYYSDQQPTNNTLLNNREQPNLNHNYQSNYEPNAQEYNYLRDEITTKVTSHTNKLVDNLEYKFVQMNENIERKQEEVFGVMFDRLNKTLEEISRQSNIRTENRNTEINHIPNNRQQDTQTRTTTSTTKEERETTVTEPPLPFYKQLKSMNLNGEPQLEQSISSGSVPTTKRPFDGTDPAYTVEEYLSSIVAAMIFSSGIEPVNKPGNHQWKVKRAAFIVHTLQGPAQKWYSTSPSETKLDWETFCIEFSDMFNSEKSKQ